MTKGRVIVVTLSEPYPFGHVSGRWYYALLKELVRRRYEVRCLSVTSNSRWAELAERALVPLGVDLSFHPIEAFRGRILGKLRTIRQPFSYSLSSGLRKEFAKEIRKGYDVIHLEQLWSGYLAHQKARSLVVVHHLSSLDLAGLSPFGGTRLLLNRLLVHRGERYLLRRLNNISTLSDRLARELSLMNPKASVYNVPFGFDPSLYPFVTDPGASNLQIGFLGNMRWTPGYLAARRLVSTIFPLIKRLVPGAKLLLGGWEARQALHEFVDHTDVTITENVPDAQEFFRQLQVLAYPVPCGTGVKVKVLEAMAWGIPVVTTTDGVEGIHAINGRDCFVADDDEAFARKVVELLRNRSLGRMLCQAARSLVENEHSPPPVVDRLEEVYAAL